MTRFDAGPKVSFDTIAEGWGLFRERLGVWIPTMLVWFVLEIALDQLTRAIVSDSGSLPLKAATSLVSLLLTSFLTAGLVRMALKQVRGEEIGVGDLFSGGSSFLGLAYKQFLIGLLTFAAAVVVGIVGLGNLGLLLGIAVAVGLCIGLLNALWFLSDAMIVDTEQGAVDAMRSSFEATTMEFGSTIALVLALGLLQVAGLLACGVGLLATMPLIYLVPVLVYRNYFPERFAPDFEP